MEKVTFHLHDTDQKNQTERVDQESPVFQEASPLPDPSMSCNALQGVRALDAPLPPILPTPWLRGHNKWPANEEEWLTVFHLCLDRIDYLESLLPDHLLRGADVRDVPAAHRPTG